MEWLQSNWLPLVVIIVVVILFIIKLIKKCLEVGMREAALDAILQAEKEFTSGKGKEKMQFAIDYVFDLLPLYVKVLVPKNILIEFVHKFIQTLFDEVKKLLDYQKPNVEILEGGKK